MKVRALSAMVLLLGLTACSIVAPASDGGPEAIAHSAPYAVPLASRFTWTAAQRTQLRAAMDGALQSHWFARAGVAIADESGHLLYGRNDSRGYAPASTFKTIVAATALATFGANAHLDTALAALDRPDADGRVDDLWLLGSGDPELDPDQLHDGIAALARDGVRRVDGDVIVDARSFTEPEQNRAWAPDDFEYGYAAGTSAISLNWNVIEFKVTPTRIGEAARISVYPADPDIVIHGTATTGYSTTLTIERTAPGRNSFAIGGSIADLGEQSFYRPVEGIPLWAAQVVAQMLRDEHIAFDGRARLGTDALALQTLWQHSSPPLAAMIHQMLFESDNHIAEQLLRVVGLRGGDGLVHAGGSESAGARAERAYLRSVGVPMPGLRIVDGSGLAESDRVAPVTLVRLLQAAAHAPTAHAYVTAFPRAGIEGTVRHHELTSAYGRVRAKSGHIDGVNALAGYVDTRHHGRLAFAFLVNEPDADDAISIQIGIDRALDSLADL